MEQLFISTILDHSSKIKASDIHISEGKILTFRVNGDLVKQKESGIMDNQQAATVLGELMGNDKKLIDAFYEKKDADFTYIHSDGISFRVNAFFKLGKLSFVLRRISNIAKPMSELGLPSSVNQLTKLKQGLILVTGPTGAGKSTTMVSFLNEINKTRGEHIITIEDPIEFVFQDDKSIFSQRQVGKDTNSFPDALRAAMREDPDIIMIGEMRDAETVKTALELAETGHLVISTLHTSSASTTITRLLSFFPPDVQESIKYKLSDTIQGVVSQRLINRKDTQGRVAIFEVMLGVGGVKNLIRKGDFVQLQAQIEVGKKHGMIAMKDYADFLNKKGIIDSEDYIHYFKKEES